MSKHHLTVVTTFAGNDFLSTDLELSLPPANYDAACIFHDLARGDTGDWKARGYALDQATAEKIHERLVATIKACDANQLTPIHGIGALLDSPKKIALFNQPLAVRNQRGQLGIVDWFDNESDAGDFFDIRLQDHFGFSMRQLLEVGDRFSVRHSWPESMQRTREGHC